MQMSLVNGHPTLGAPFQAEINEERGGEGERMAGSTHSGGHWVGERVQPVNSSGCNGYYGWCSMGASGDEQSRQEREEGMDIKQNRQVLGCWVEFCNQWHYG